MWNELKLRLKRLLRQFIHTSYPLKTGLNWISDNMAIIALRILESPLIFTEGITVLQKPNN